MAKKIYPGNYVNALSAYQGQPVVEKPGVLAHQVVGYAKIDATGGTEFDVVIPSPDRRGPDKRLPDITGLVIPSGAYLYRIGVRVLDNSKEGGTAASGLALTNGDRLKVATAVTVAPETLNSATSAAGAALTAAAATVAPAQGIAQVDGGILTTAPLTLKLFVDDGANAAGSTASSSSVGGSYVVVEACYFMWDDVPAEVMTPYIVESA